jgi:hypothetical protein
MKKKIFFAFILVSILFSPIFVQAVDCEEDFEDVGGVCFPTETGLSDKPVKDIVENFMKWILAIVGFLAIIAFVISGIQYMFSAGDEKTIDTAKSNMKWSIVGVAVAISGLIIIKAIDIMLKGTSVEF